MNFKYFVVFLFAVISFGATAQIIVKANDPHIHYMGRVDVTDSAAVLSWSGNSAKINFRGTGIKFTLRDERADNYLDVILDGKMMSPIHETKNLKLGTLIDNLPSGNHTLELFKRTEWAMGKLWLYNFEIEKGGEVLPATPAHKRKIEFFGNSISCGYAALDTEGKDRGTSTYEDGYNSYAALTARHFNAEFHNTSKSGIGITVSWFPLVMSEMYDRLDATDPNRKWDFSKYTPDVVVINLFQNDSWIVKKPDNDQFKAKFGTTPPNDDFIINAYRSFVKSVRGKYPKASIICILGSMDATQQGSPWPGYIDKAVAALSDNNIYTHFIPYKNTPGHPSLKEQQDMANDLEAFIAQKIKW